ASTGGWSPRCAAATATARCGSWPNTSRARSTCCPACCPRLDFRLTRPVDSRPPKGRSSYLLPEGSREMSTTTPGRDEQRLAELGYSQDLNRAWSGFSNFAISFTIISILAGCVTTYGQAWNNG